MVVCDFTGWTGSAVSSKTHLRTHVAQLYWFIHTSLHIKHPLQLLSKGLQLPYSRSLQQFLISHKNAFTQRIIIAKSHFHCFIRPLFPLTAHPSALRTLNGLLIRKVDRLDILPPSWQQAQEECHLPPKTLCHDCKAAQRKEKLFSGGGCSHQGDEWPNYWK